MLSSVSCLFLLNYANHAAFLKEESASKRFNFDLMTCKFPGTRVFSMVQSLQKLKSEVDSQELKIREREGWLTPYNIRHNFTSNWRVLEPLRRQQVLAKALAELEAKALEALGEVFENATVIKREQKKNIKLMEENEL